jgi:glycosyltransferase involved in cell wall biosynthesis
MKLVVFAHTPPPHHGQSYMVQLMLEGFGGDRRKKIQPSAEAKKYGIECYHVNSRLSRDLEDIGTFRVKKNFLLFGYCLSAIWCRFRYGAKTLYYIPAPGKRSALLRDWMVMFFCRPFFEKIIFQWHAAGLAKWLETAVQMRTRSLTYRLMKNADLSIALTDFNRGEGEKLTAKKIVVVPNAIPDPCSNFSPNLLARRIARSVARRKLSVGQTLTAQERENSGDNPNVFRMLFVAHCTREKGLFDAVEGVALANQRLMESGSPMRIHLDVAGAFINADEQAEFDKRIQQSDLMRSAAEETSQTESSSEKSVSRSRVTYHGFAAGAEKTRLFSDCDGFCFPTYYYAESFPVVLLEAMAFGMQIVTSKWRSVPAVLPENYPWLVEIRNPQQIADALLQLATSDYDVGLRQRFVENFTIEKHLERLAKAFHEIENVEKSDAVPSPQTAS